jgi:hypothetical protein
MKTHVVYKYRAPGSDPDQDEEIKTEAMPGKPEIVLKQLQAEGQALSLWYDHPEKHGSQQNYKVLERYIAPGTKNVLNIIVTDPDSEQMPYGAGGSCPDINPLERENPTEHRWREPPGSPEAASETSESSTGPQEQQGSKSEPEWRQVPWWQRLFGSKQ